MATIATTAATTKATSPATARNAADRAVIQVGSLAGRRPPQHGGQDPEAPPPVEQGGDRPIPPVVAVGRAATAPDVVQDLLRPHQVEEGDEPGADRPPFRVPQPAHPERGQVAVQAAGPGDQEPEGDGHQADLEQPRHAGPQVARVEVSPGSRRWRRPGEGRRAGRRRRSPRRRSRSRRWLRRAARGRPWRACDLSGRDEWERSTSRWPVAAVVHCRAATGGGSSVGRIARDGGDGARTCSWNLPSSTAAPGHRWSSCSEGRARTARAMARGPFSMT